MATEDLSQKSKAYYHEYFHGAESRELRRIAAMRLTDGDREVIREAEADARDCEESMARTFTVRRHTSLVVDWEVVNEAGEVEAIFDTREQAEAYAAWLAGPRTGPVPS